MRNAQSTATRLAGAVRGVDLDAHENANLFLTGP